MVIKLSLFIFLKTLRKRRMIKATNLEKHYSIDEVEIIALRDLSIEVEQGEFVAIMGSSGCGK